MSREALKVTSIDEHEACANASVKRRRPKQLPWFPESSTAELLQLTETKKSERGFGLRKRLRLGFRVAELEMFQRSANPL